MTRLPALLAAAACAVAVAAVPAEAANVAYIEDNNVWLSSPDGAVKHQLTKDGTAEQPWSWPITGPDGKTIAVHSDSFEGGKRPVLYLWGADGKFATANVMPVYSGATVPVYPIGLDMDWSSNAVAYGYQYCGFACKTIYRGYWLTFSDNQGAYPTNPQGQGDAMNPTFYGKRVISSDSGGSIFVQPDVAEAPFTNSYSGWLHHDQLYFSRAEVAPAGRQMAIEWSPRQGEGKGIVIGQHEGTVPSNVSGLCDLPTAANPGNLTFSPDATQIAWRDDEGVKVAGAPNLAAGTDTCTLSAPAKVISATGKLPHFGGADVAAIARGGAPAPAATSAATTTPATTGGPAPGTAQPKKAGASATTAKDAPVLAVTLTGKATRAAFKKGLTIEVAAPAAGAVSASASIPAAVARKLRLTGRRGKIRAFSVSRAGARGFAAASSVVVARGSAKATKAGRVRITLRPTAKARKAARRMKGVTLTVRVSQAGAGGSARIGLR